MRHQINHHPVRTLAILLVLAFAFFNLSAAGQPGTDWENGPKWLGDPSWFLFLACALAFIVIGVLTVVRVMRGRTR
jgi:hypothetical protein